ncbi:tail fiber protein [Yersinia kristensenii]|uniref:tail fiber protein n=1 Tax=Yersinia kristensenii TaxID=28152 RepID=UPI001FE6EF82|nr:tail fiber protein [Yersinia kristensenii]
MARKDSFNQPWASVPAQFERPGDGLIARGWAGGASEDPPEAKWENWWHNRVDLALQELQNLGQLIWFVDAPYKAGARVNYGGNSFIALSNNTGVEPTGLLDVGVWRKESTKTYLQTANNLSEIKAAGPVAVAQAIDNLGLKDTAATAAGALQKTQNLNDVANKTTALTNLGALPVGGTAVAATKLATARNIAGKPFDGTANISIGAADVGALPLTGGVLSGPLKITGIHGEPIGPAGYRSFLIGPTNGGITNPTGTGIGLHSDKNIYFWNDDSNYAMTLSPTSLSVNRPISILSGAGAALSIKSQNEGDVCYIMSVSNTASKSKWYIGNTQENNTSFDLVNSKAGVALKIGDTISTTAPFSASKITPSDYSNFDERYEPALIGTPIPWPLATAPSGYLKCNGASFNKTQYPKLALAYPSGVLPDLRGEFIRGFDDGRGVRPNQALLGWQGSEIQSHNHSITNFEIRGATGGPTNAWFPSANGISTNNSGGDETRPRNVAFNYIVRAL